MNQSLELPFFASIPHSGEQVPSEVTWLQGLPEPVLMRDVDRYVDHLYQPSLDELELPAIITPWHRYVVDLNRTPDQYDQSSVIGAAEPPGKHPRGLHWSVTTLKEPLITEAMSPDLHEKLVQDYYQPFHDSVRELRQTIHQVFEVCYHLDLHSMPSKGTDLHSDPGEERAEVVVSDFHGASSEPFYKDLVMGAYQKAGFQVAYNWPYVGGGITRMYGEPEKGFHTIQVELNRVLYMDEDTKKLNQQKARGVQSQLKTALELIQAGVRDRLNG